MNTTAENNFELIAPQMQRLSTALFDNLDTDVPLVSQIAEYILSSGGKRLRPMLVFLTGGMFGNTDPKLDTIACAIEYIHTATLLHDDVVDRADLRRHRKTVNTIWGNESAILVGDYLYSRALSLLSDLQKPELMKLITDTTTRIAEGEIFQLVRGYDDTAEEHYITIITRKTASLLGAAMGMSALLSGASQELQKLTYEYGVQIGQAFQVVDDIMDVSGEQEKIGKPVGTDIREGKVTLPFILLLKKCSPEEKNKLFALLRNTELSEGEVAEFMRLLQHYDILTDAFSYATTILQNAKEKARHFPQNEFTATIAMAAEYISTRKH